MSLSALSAFRIGELLTVGLSVQESCSRHLSIAHCPPRIPALRQSCRWAAPYHLLDLHCFCWSARLLQQKLTEPIHRKEGVPFFRALNRRSVVVCALDKQLGSQCIIRITYHTVLIILVPCDTQVAQGPCVSAHTRLVLDTLSRLLIHRAPCDLQACLCTWHHNHKAAFLRRCPLPKSPDLSALRPPLRQSEEHLPLCCGVQVEAKKAQRAKSSLCWKGADLAIAGCPLSRQPCH